MSTISHHGRASMISQGRSNSIMSHGRPSMVSHGRASVVSHGKPSVVNQGRPSHNGPGVRSHGGTSAVSQYAGRSAVSTLKKLQPGVEDKEELIQEEEEYLDEDGMDNLSDIDLDMFSEEGKGEKAPDKALDYTMTVNWADR